MKKTDGISIFKNIINREVEFLLYTRRNFFIFTLLGALVSFIILIAIFRNPVIRDVPIAVIDKDNTQISRELIRTIDASSDVRVAYKLANNIEARQLITNAKIYGVVTIPDDFTKKVLGYKGAKVPFNYNAQLVVIGGVANRGVTSAVQDFSNRYNKVYEETGGVPAYASSAKAEPIIFNNKTLFNPYLNYQYFMLSGVLPAILQLFILGSFVYSFGFELKSKQAEYLIEPMDYAPFITVIAKSTVYWVIGLLNGGLMLYCLFGYIGMPMVGSKMAVLIGTFLFITASTSAGMVILFLSSGSLRMGLSIMAVYAAPAFAYAGITFPYLGMPPLARLWSEFLPLTHYHRILVNDAMRGATYSSTPMEMLYLFLFSVLTFIIGTYMYLFLVRRPSMWGKL